MKRLIATLSLVVTLTGCSFFKKHSPEIATIAGAAATVGTSLRLKTNPGDRPYFVAAAQALTRLIDSGNYDPAQFTQVLQSLPINELSGPNGSLYISVAVVVWDELASQADSIQKQEQVAAVIRAVRDGIRAGLGSGTGGA